MMLNQQPDLYAQQPLRYVDGIPVFSHFDEYVENYEQIAKDELRGIDERGENPFIDEALWREFEDSTASLIEKYSAPGASILDVGVGLGRLLARFPHLKRYGIDVSLEVLRRARQQGIEVSCGFVEDLPYSPNTFDIIVCTDVLEHVLDLNRACIRMLKTLKDDGILIVRVPYREDLSPYLQPTYPYRFVHMRAFDEWSLRLLFERILGQIVIEWNTSGYLAYHQYFRYHLPGKDLLVRGSVKLLSWLKRINPKLHRSMLKRLFRPIEINVVIRKQAFPDYVRISA